MRACVYGSHSAVSSRVADCRFATPQCALTGCPAHKVSFANSANQHAGELCAHFRGEQSVLSQRAQHLRREVAVPIVQLEAKFLGTDSCDEGFARARLTKEDPKVHTTDLPAITRCRSRALGRFEALHRTRVPRVFGVDGHACVGCRRSLRRRVPSRRIRQGRGSAAAMGRRRLRRAAAWRGPIKPILHSPRAVLHREGWGGGGGAAPAHHRDPGS